MSKVLPLASKYKNGGRLSSVNLLVRKGGPEFCFLPADPIFISERLKNYKIFFKTRKCINETLVDEIFAKIGKMGLALLKKNYYDYYYYYKTKPMK